MATILLTGVTGAVGSSLAPLLKERGHKLICLVRGDNPIVRIDRVFISAFFCKCEYGTFRLGFIL